MSSLTAIFGNSEDKAHDSEKLLNLYWNRAELKKEFAGMRKEQFRLQDRIKQHEGATARVQQKLDHLEDLLVDPKWVHNVVVFYQLRALAVQCGQKLANFAEQLKQQREQKQHNSILVRWNEARTQEGKAVEQEILAKRASLQECEDQLHNERQRLMNMSGILKIFRRRSVTASLDKLAEQIDDLRQEEIELTEFFTEIRDRIPPENEGLGIQTKRSINLMILSFAQQMVANFEDDDFAGLVRESSEKSVGAINYGSRSDCNELLDRIHKHAEIMEHHANFASALQLRAKLLGQKAVFQDDTDTIPVAASVATLIKIDSNNAVEESPVNIVGENYWAISSAFTR